MQMNTPKDPMFVPDFHYSGETTEEVKKVLSELEDWLIQLQRSLEEYYKKVYYDLSLGASRHRLYTTVPTTTDLNDGEIALYTSGSNFRMYSNTSGLITLMVSATV